MRCRPIFSSFFYIHRKLIRKRRLHVSVRGCQILFERWFALEAIYREKVNKKWTRVAARGVNHVHAKWVRNDTSLEQFFYFPIMPIQRLFVLKVLKSCVCTQFTCRFSDFREKQVVTLTKCFRFACSAERVYGFIWYRRALSTSLWNPRFQRNFMHALKECHRPV